MHSGRANSLPDLVRKIELPGCNWNDELCCVPPTAAPYLSSRFRIMRGKFYMRNLRSLKSEIRFQNPSSIARVSVLAYSDAAHSGTYGQGGYLAGLCIHQLDRTMLYFIIDWHSASLKRVSFSSTGAEILAAAYAADRGLALTANVRQFASAPKDVLFELTLDSRRTLDTMATFHVGRDFRLHPTVCRLHDGFLSGEINIMRWAPGLKNITDALTKRNYAMFSLLNNICVPQFYRSICSNAKSSTTSKHGDEVSPAAYLSVCHKHSVWNLSALHLGCSVLHHPLQDCVLR
jgi:hypothetical protein